jgi:hypothetical protein
MILIQLLRPVPQNPGGVVYWNRKEEGVTHINAYSKSLTWLGRELSNFSDRPFTCPEFGGFRSMEGYWYFLLSGNEALKELAGWEAKKVGKKSRPGAPPPFFEGHVRRALRLKIAGHEDLKGMLKASTLPIAHYYFMKDWQTGGMKVKPADSYPWVIEELEDIRGRLQGEYRPERVWLVPEVPGDQFSMF